MDDHEHEAPVFDLSNTPLAAGIEAAFGIPETAPEKQSWMCWDKGDPDRGR